MGILEIILLIIFVIASLLLILIVLLQDEQGEGLGGLFGGGGSTAFGSRSGNVLTKFTSILGAIFLITSFALAWASRTAEKGDVLGAARKSTTVETEEWWNVEESEMPETGASE